MAQVGFETKINLAKKQEAVDQKPKKNIYHIKIELTDYQPPVFDPSKHTVSGEFPYVPYGEKNDYPNTLASFAKYCPEHAQFLKLKKNLIKGSGFIFKKEIPGLEDFLKKEIGGNRRNTANRMLDLIAFDMAVYESFTLQIRYNYYGEVVSIARIDPAKVRCREVDAFGNITHYYICADWRHKERYGILELPAYNPDAVLNMQGELVEPTQIFHYVTPGIEPYFPFISYESVLNYIALSKELGIYGVNLITNGFFTGAILSVPSDPEQEEKDVLVGQINDTFTGSHNAGKIMVTFVGEGGKEITVTPIATGDNTASITAFNELAIQKICTAHGGQSILASIDRAGASLGGDKNMINAALELYRSTVIAPMQAPIIEIFSELLDLAGFEGNELAISDTYLVKRSIPEALIGKVLTTNEVRVEGGYETRTDGETYIEQDPFTSPVPAPTTDEPTA